MMIAESRGKSLVLSAGRLSCIFTSALPLQTGRPVQPGLRTYCKVPCSNQPSFNIQNSSTSKCRALLGPFRVFCFGLEPPARGLYGPGTPAPPRYSSKAAPAARPSPPWASPPPSPEPRASRPAFSNALPMPRSTALRCGSLRSAIACERTQQTEERRQNERQSNHERESRQCQCQCQAK